MTQDSLEKLAVALAAEHDGAHVAPDITRARVMQRLARERRKKRMRFVLFVPLLGIGIGSSAFAASGADWPEALAWVPALFNPGDGSKAVAPQPIPASRTDSAEVEIALTPRDPEGIPSAAKVPDPAARLPFIREETQAKRDPLPTEHAPSRGDTRTQVPARAPDPIPASSSITLDRKTELPPPPPALEADIGLSLYRRAHDAQFKASDCRTALAGYRAYLEEHPTGALATEASYNAALCELRLGRTEAARRSLTPFARGAYGSYRQQEARALLEALEAP